MWVEGSISRQLAVSIKGFAEGLSELSRRPSEQADSGYHGWVGQRNHGWRAPQRHRVHDHRWKHQQRVVLKGCQGVLEIGHRQEEDCQTAALGAGFEWPGG